ncbi:hypothetical protein DIPPA_18427 [Diplonema papillatum]|nr:hypothetical protein DIPPA_18427 [Diplonema papillatum]
MRANLVWFAASLAVCHGFDIFDCQTQLLREHGFGSEACDSEHYILHRVLIPFYPFVVLAVVCLISCPVFLISRSWLKCCGGAHPAPDTICFVKEYSVSPITAYSEEHIHRWRKLPSCAMAFFLAGFACTFGGSIAMFVAYDTGFKAAQQAPLNLKHDKVDNFLSCMEVQEENDDVVELGSNVLDWDNSTFEAALDALSASAAEVKDEKDSFRKYRTGLLYGLIVFLVLCSAPAVASIVLALGKELGRVPMTFAAYGWVFLFFALLFFGLSSSAFLFVRDACDTLDLEIGHGGENKFFRPLLDHACTSNDISKYIAAAASARDDMVMQACDGFESFVGSRCNKTTPDGAYFLCAGYVSATCPNHSFDLFSEYLHSPDAILITGNACGIETSEKNCSVSRCADDCSVGSDAYEASTAIEELMAEATQGVACVDTYWPRSVTCPDIMRQYGLEPQQDTCDGLRVGTWLLVSGISVVTMSLLFSIVVLVHGAKVFRDDPPALYTATGLISADGWGTRGNVNAAVRAQPTMDEELDDMRLAE